MEWSPEKGETNNPGDALFDNWAMNQKKRGCLGYTGDCTQLCGDDFINHYKDPY